MNRHPGDRDGDDPDDDGSDAAGHGGAAGDSGAPAANGECADVFGCPGEAADDEALAAVAQQLRAEAVRDGAALAAKLERVALLGGPRSPPGGWRPGRGCPRSPMTCR